MTRPTGVPALDCDEVVRQLWDLLDAEVDAARAAELEQHLSLCRDCTEHFAFAERFLARVHEPARDDAGTAALRERVRGAVNR